MKKYLKFKPHRHKYPDYRSSTMLQETQCKFQFAAEIRRKDSKIIWDGKNRNVNLSKQFSIT